MEDHQNMSLETAILDQGNLDRKIVESFVSQNRFRQVFAEP